MSDPVAPVVPVAAEAPAESTPVVKAAEAEPSDEYVINGEKVILTRTQARTRIQKEGALDKRMQETTEQKKKLDSLIADFEKDPESALAKMGKDPEKILEALVARKAKLALLTPEQREAQALKDERDALKAEKDKRDKEQQDKADTELDQHNAEVLEEQLIAVADKYGLDHSPEALKELAGVALELIGDFGLAPTLDQLAQEVIQRDKEHLEARDRKLLPSLKGERLKQYLKANVATLLKLPAAELLDLLGPDGVKAIQAATLTRQPGAVPVKVKPTTITAPARNGSSGRFISESAFDRKYK